jgi:amino acid transporter
LKTFALIGLNLFLLGLFVFLVTRKGLLTYRQSRRWWLTWLAIGIITLMDEFTSIFYVPAEAYRFIGPEALVFIALTSLLIRFISTRFTEIGEILEKNNLIGGGVYSFSYLVLGPVVSFVGVASIMVAYTITACISAVSAVANAISFTPFAQLPHLTLLLSLGVLWLVAGLNIAGIKANARFTFAIFIFATFVILNLIVSGLLDFDKLGSPERVAAAVHGVFGKMKEGSWLDHYGIFVSHVAFCILAYSGIESVIQTASLVRSWHDIRKAYWFLALTVGLTTPLVAILTLSAPINVHQHELDLIPYFATLINGKAFGVLVAGLAAFTLMMAVNTAFVASSELLERVAERYAFRWLKIINRRGSLYRIHIMNATFFSAVVIITGAQQGLLADMYAIGLLASFCINLGSLIIYRYRMGTTEIEYSTSRLGTLVLWAILVSCFAFLAVVKGHGTVLWGIVTLVVLAAGMMVARRRSPEIKAIAKGDTVDDLVEYLQGFQTRTLHIFFRRGEEPKHGMEEKAPGRERQQHGVTEENSAYITFFSPLAGVPPKNAPNHFRLPLSRIGVYQEIVGLLQVIEAEFPNRHVVVNIGWPLSSWLDRLSITVLYIHIMRLPRLFPSFEFIMRYVTRVPIAEKKVIAKREAREENKKEVGKH